MDPQFRIFRRDARVPDIDAAFAPWAEREHWLFVSPHDDDVLIGAGLWIQALIAAGAGVSIAIVTDGRMGYSDADQRDTIVARRETEAQAAYGKLGVKSVVALGLPDGSLAQHAGSRLEQGTPAGLECALTRLLRNHKPTRVVTTDSADWHPDHRATFEGARMAIFHACGAIWGELGAPLAALPSLYTFAVYAPFESEPDILIEGSKAAIKAKLDALREFSSQAGIIERVSKSAGHEYLRRVSTSPHDASTYRALFPR